MSHALRSSSTRLLLLSNHLRSISGGRSAMSSPSSPSGSGSPSTPNTVHSPSPRTAAQTPPSTSTSSTPAPNNSDSPPPPLPPPTPPGTPPYPRPPSPPKEWNFPLSPIPPNPLGEGRYIKTAAALIIGDEILNGKTFDRNSNYFARFCFEHGIQLRRIEVIGDNEDEIIEASRRMVKNYDFVITTGGIGPTHDDITYAALAKSFHRPLAHHPETLARLRKMTAHRPWAAQQNSAQREATERMALFPSAGQEDGVDGKGEKGVEVLFVGGDMWVPVVRLEGKLCIFPGIPTLFQKLLHGLTPFLPLPPVGERPLRLQVFTSRPETLMAPYLTALQTRVAPHQIQIGSYPVLQKGVYVSLIGADRERVSVLAEEVAREVGGRVVGEEELRGRKEGEARAVVEGEVLRKSD